MGKSPVYLVFGTEGLLGRGLLTRLGSKENQFRIFSFPHRFCDINEPSHVTEIMEYVRPTVVLNCASINDCDICEDAPKGAFFVNGKGPETVAAACKKFEAKLVQFSTSNVFDGESMPEYSESDKESPINIHGQSKFTGEECVREQTDNHLIIRTGWAFNYESQNWITEWMSQLDSGVDIHAINDVFGSPSYVPDIMDGVMNLLDVDAKGTFHIANSGGASQHDIAALLVKLTKSKRKAVKMAAETQKFWKAPIPTHTVLSSAKYENLTGKPMRPWQDALKHCLFSMSKYTPD